MSCASGPPTSAFEGTVAVAADKVGFSICNPLDRFKKEQARSMAAGRALAGTVPNIPNRQVMDGLLTIDAKGYFNIPDTHAVCHFMGPAEETRHLWIGNEQAVVSPPWSMHSGVGTANYTFIWGMGGENLDYGDQDFFKNTDLR